MSLPSAHEFLGIVRPMPVFSDLRYGHIHTSYASGRPRVRFDGETAAGTELYPRLASYTPVANDRIALARIGTEWLVLGRVI